MAVASTNCAEAPATDRSPVPMRRTLLFIPLLALAPLGDFLGLYLEGAGILPGDTGFLIGAVSFFALPWAIAALFLTVRVAWPTRVFFFIGALLAQVTLMFTVVPAGAASEMMGIAHRLRHEFPPDQMRVCAASLRQKEDDGTLVVRNEDKGQSFLISKRAVLVDDSELPISLRGRFESVFIQPDSNTGERRVYFSLDERAGIVCDRRTYVRETCVWSIADGVHAYRYMRP